MKCLSFLSEWVTDGSLQEGSLLLFQTLQLKRSLQTLVWTPLMLQANKASQDPLFGEQFFSRKPLLRPVVHHRTTFHILANSPILSTISLLQLPGPGLPIPLGQKNLEWEESKASRDKCSGHRGQEQASGLQPQPYGFLDFLPSWKAESQYTNLRTWISTPEAARTNSVQHISSVNITYCCESNLLCECMQFQEKKAVHAENIHRKVPRIQIVMLMSSCLQIRVCRMEKINKDQIETSNHSKSMHLSGFTWSHCPGTQTASPSHELQRTLSKLIFNIRALLTVSSL